MKLDETQVQNLQSIQWKVEEALTLSSTTPATLAELYGDFPVPTAPEDRPAYTYSKTDKGFKLCATFSRDSVMPDTGFSSTINSEQKIKNPDNWSYKSGEYCFDRLVK